MKEQDNNHNVFIGIGSNINKSINIKSCLFKIKEKFKNIIISPIYETNSMGFNGDNFYNLVCSFVTKMDLYILKKFLNDIESNHGRSFSETKFSPRTLDIDILYFDKIITKNKKIEIPRKEILRYDFVLQPLTDIAPDFIHPEIGLSHINILKKGDYERLIIKKVYLD